MTDVGRTVLAETLELSNRERADIAAELLASLHSPQESGGGDFEDEWADEIRRRVEKVRSGESDTATWEQVRADAEQRLARR